MCISDKPKSNVYEREMILTMKNEMSLQEFRKMLDDFINAGLTPSQALNGAQAVLRDRGYTQDEINELVMQALK